MTALLLSVVVAATPITLDEVRSEARNNLAAIQAELTWVEQYEQVAFERGNLLPQLAISAGGQRSWFSATPARTGFTGGGQGIPLEATPAYWVNYFSLGANLSQVVFNLVQWYQLKQAGELERANKGLAEDQADASELEAIRRFFVLYTAQDSLRVLEETAHKSKELWDRAEALYEAGKGIKGDALAAHVNYGTDLNNALQQHIAVVQAQADLASWLGRAETDELVALEPKGFGQKPPPPPAFIVAEGVAKHRRAILRADAAQIDAAQSNITIQQGNLFPRINLNVGWAHAANDFGTVFTSFTQYNQFAGQLNLSWTIFDGMSTFALSRQAEEQKHGFEATYRQALLDVSGQVRTALDLLTNQMQALDVLSENREVAVKNLEYFQERFNAGASNTLDVRDAQVKLLSAELSLLQTKANVENAKANLARAMGTLSNGEQP
ncbi:MAG: TolC family protein [Myxococcaceae bacterium]